MNFKDKKDRILDTLVRFVYPKFCPLCNDIIPLGKDYCHCSDFDSIRLKGDCCNHCGYSIEKCVCGIKNTVSLPSVAGVYIYNGRIRADILNLKFNNEKKLAAKLGTDMAERCASVYCDIDFDLITFPPMNPNSFKIRDYNQSELLAKEVAEKFFLPVEELFEKNEITAAQHTLKGTERLENIRNSITLNEKANVKGKVILICDDVKTTGSTLDCCVKLLEKAGASAVHCLCVALSDFMK